MTQKDLKFTVPGGANGKESTCQCRLDIRDMGSVPGSGRSPGRGHGNPLHCSCLENSMARGDQQAAVHGVVESDMTEVTQHTCTNLLNSFSKQPLKILLLPGLMPNGFGNTWLWGFLFVLFLFFDHATQHMESQFPNQGWNPCPPAVEAKSLNHQITRKSYMVVF